ncbi:MAG: metallophosphoesterase [Leptospirales bacterium]
MEIIYLTDIHDNLKRLRHVIQDTRADLYIISGDLIYKAFFTETKLYEFVSLQEEFFYYLVRKKIRGTPLELARSIIRMPEAFPAGYLVKAKRYQELFAKAASNMKAKYLILKRLVETYAKAEVLFLPGNYDRDLQYTALDTYDIHKKNRVIQGIDFAGYGGAPIATSGIPESVSVVFYEYIVNGKLHSEPLEQFQKQKPDVLLLHNPAYATLDKIASHGHIGSMGVRQYIDDYEPTLALSGHVHSDRGLMKINNTYCINPSNFGAVDTMNGHDDGGFFCRIFMHKKKPETVFEGLVLYKYFEKHILPVLEINIKNNKPVEKVLNEKIYNEIGSFIR